MDRNAIEKIFSTERLEPDVKYHAGDFNKAILHYKANIEISETFYPLLSVLEIGLRNNIDYQLKRRFNDESWYENVEFIKIVANFQIDQISEARNKILKEKKSITSGKIVSELSFGFWTSLFNSKFERSLWKNLRHAFPNCPKRIRQRKTMSTKLNGIRKLRNRIFHHESIFWSINAISNYKKDLIEGIDWLNRGLLEWSFDLNRFDEVLSKRKSLIEEAATGNMKI